MWALIEGSNIVREFNRPQDVRIGDIHYPSSIFTDKTLLKELNIRPIQVINTGAPPNNIAHVFEFTVSDNVTPTKVIRTRLWMPLTGAPLVDRNEKLKQSTIARLLGHARGLVDQHADNQLLVIPAEDVAFADAVQMELDALATLIDGLSLSDLAFGANVELVVGSAAWPTP
jgi:hypothetical protein